MDKLKSLGRSDSNASSSSSSSNARRGKGFDFRGEFKGIDQVATWMGKERKLSTEHAYAHEAAPLSSLRDPASFGPPPRHVGHSDPNYTPPGLPHEGAAASQRQPPNVPSRAPKPGSKLQEVEREIPQGPYRVDTTGLSTAGLPAPPIRRLQDTPSSSSTTTARPVPHKPAAASAHTPRQSVPATTAESDPPSGPFQADTTGLKISGLPKPPMRSANALQSTPIAASLPSTTAPAPPPRAVASSQASNLTPGRLPKPAVPPRVPPRDLSPKPVNSTGVPDSPPPAYSPASTSSKPKPPIAQKQLLINTEATQRLQKSGLLPTFPPSPQSQPSPSSPPSHIAAAKTVSQASGNLLSSAHKLQTTGPSPSSHTPVTALSSTVNKPSIENLRQGISKIHGLGTPPASPLNSASNAPPSPRGQGSVAPSFNDLKSLAGSASALASRTGYATPGSSANGASVPVPASSNDGNRPAKPAIPARTGSFTIKKAPAPPPPMRSAAANAAAAGSGITNGESRDGTSANANANVNVSQAVPPPVPLNTKPR